MVVQVAQRANQKQGKAHGRESRQRRGEGCVVGVRNRKDRVKERNEKGRRQRHSSRIAVKEETLQCCLGSTACTTRSHYYFYCWITTITWWDYNKISSSSSYNATHFTKTEGTLFYYPLCAQPECLHIEILIFCNLFEIVWRYIRAINIFVPVSYL